jgi:hypothetical protein
MILGFYLWYVRVQRPMDLILKSKGTLPAETEKETE